MEFNQEFDIKAFYEKIGKNVAKYRKEAGLSQLKLAMLMDLNSVSLVASAETYRKSGKHFNLEHICKIRQILKISYNELLN